MAATIKTSVEIRLDGATNAAPRRPGAAT